MRIFFSTLLFLFLVATLSFADAGYTALLNKAYSLYQKADYSSALDYYSSSLKKATRQESVNSLLGIQNCLLMQAEYKKAIDTGNVILKIQKDNLYALYNTALSYYNQKNYDKALDFYLSMVRYDPKNFSGLNGAAWSAYLSGDLDAAKKHLKDGLQYYPANSNLISLYDTIYADTFEVWVKYAYKSYLAGYYADSEKRYRDCLRHFSNLSKNEQADAVIGVQNSQIAMKQYKELIAFSRDYLKDLSDNPYFLANLGYSLFAIKQFSAASQFYSKLSSLNKNNIAAAEWLTRSYILSGAEEKAEKFLHESVKSNPDSIILKNLSASLDAYTINLQSAYSFYLKPDYQTAAEFYKECLKTRNTKSKDLDARLGIQNCLVKLGEFNQAVDYGKELLREYPENYFISANIGYSYYALKQYAESAATYADILKKYKYDPVATAKLCWSFILDLKPEPARNTAHDFLKNFPENIELKGLYESLNKDLHGLYMNIAYNSFRYKDFDRARKYYETAFEKTSDITKRMNAVMGMLNCHMNLQNYKYVTEFGTDILNIHPGQTFIRAKVAYSFFQLRNYSKAIQHYKLILKDYPADTTSLSGIAWSAYYDNDPDTARDYIETMKKLKIPATYYSNLKNLVDYAWKYKHDPYYKYMNTAYSHYTRGDSTSALAYYKKAQTAYTDKSREEKFNTDLGIMNCHVKLGKYKRALETGYSLLLDFPKDELLLSNLGFSHLARCEYEKAAENYRTLYKVNNNNYSAIWGLSWSYYYQGDIDRAIPFIQQAVSLNKEDQALADLHEKISAGMYQFSLSDYFTTLDYSTLSAKDTGTSNDLMLSVTYNMKNRFDAVYTASRIDYSNSVTPGLVEDDYTLSFTRLAPLGYSLLFKNIDTNDTTIGKGTVIAAGIDNRGLLISASFSDYDTTDAFQGDIGYRFTGKNYSLTTKLSSIWRNDIRWLALKKQFGILSQDLYYSLNPSTTLNLGYSYGKQSLFVKDSGFVAYNSPEEINLLSKCGVTVSNGNLTFGYTFSYSDGKELTTLNKISVVGHTFNLGLKW